MADRVALQADGSMPVRDRPACPCARCALDAEATPGHGTMQGVEAGCTCQKCRLWAWRFNRILEREADEQRFEPFGREPEAEPQPAQGSGAGTSAGNLLRRLWQRR